MKIYTFRITPGLDLKAELEKFVKAKNIQAGFIITCVGGLSQATMRMAGVELVITLRSDGRQTTLPIPAGYLTNG